MKLNQSEQPGSLSKRESGQESEFTLHHEAQDDERRDQRIRKVVERNHNVAVAALKMERLLSAEEDVNADDPRVIEIINELPSRVGKAFLRSLELVANNRESLKKKMVELYKNVDVNNEYGGGIEKTPTGLGSFVFATMCRHAKQQGEIRLMNREGYLIMICDDVDDYANVYAEVCPDADDQSRLERAKDTSGAYAHSAYICTFSSRYMGPLLIIRGDQDVDKVIRHERQHFINASVLLKFSEVETVSEAKKDYKTDHTMRGIKDEVLAAVRDGNDDIQAHMRSKLYKHFFDDLDESAAEQARQVIIKLKRFISDHRGSFRDNLDARGILVYQLASVPLLQFPKWLNAYDQIYEPRFKMLEKLGFDTTYSFWIQGRDQVEAIEGDIFPPAHHQYLQSTRDERQNILREMSGYQEHALNIAYDITRSNDEVVDEIEKARKGYWLQREKILKIYEPLLTDGHLPPHASKVSSYEYGEESEEAVEDESPFLREIQNQLLDELASYSQTEVDAIARTIEQDDRKGVDSPAALRLAKFVKDKVHALNNSGPCWVYTGDQENVPHTFYVAIDLRLPGQLGPDRVKGASFEVGMHSSKFDLTNVRQ